MHRTEIHDLLASLDAIVSHDGGAAGLLGRLAIGVVGGRAGGFWSADFGAGVTTTVERGMPSPRDFDAILGMDDDTARAILALGALPSRPSLLFVEGDRSLILRFVSRYLTPRTWLGFQADRIQARRPARRTRRGGAR